MDEAMPKAALITHQDCTLHEISAGHPEQPARIGAVLSEVVGQGLFEMLHQFEATEAARDYLVSAHSETYVDQLFAVAPDSGSVQLDADTAMNAHSLRAARLGVGAGLQAVDLVVDGDFDTAFCCVRPPGHHAERSEAMGFCFFGSVAIAALYALQKPGINRTAIIDFDVHHGNGTEDLIGDHADIFFCSTFQYPLYPGKYGKNVPGRKINLPLAAGSNGDELKRVMNEHCLPALRSFAPDLILISAGFDAHRDDPLASLEFVEDDFAWVTRELVDVAKDTANGRVVSMLEGGYDLPALGKSAAAHIRELLK
jgi:acetoin utilization deacetylase AcuC-like enzyme